MSYKTAKPYRVTNYGRGIRVPAFLPIYADQFVDYDYFGKLPEKIQWQGQTISPQVWLFIFTLEYYYGFFGREAEVTIHNNKKQCVANMNRMRNCRDAMTHLLDENKFVYLEELEDTYQDFILHQETDMNIKQLDRLSAACGISPERKLLQDLTDTYGLQQAMDYIWEHIKSQIKEADSDEEMLKLLDQVAVYSVLSLKEFRRNKKERKKAQV